jgi:conjugal transfer pilus assembly protein TraV
MSGRGRNIIGVDRVLVIQFLVFMLIMLSVIFLSGCAGFWNPYDSEFTCPLTYNGKCVSVEEAYKESFKNKDIKVNNDDDGKSKETDKECKGRDCKDTVKEVEQGQYQQAMFSELAGLIESPDTPVVAPSKVMRILILPYRSQSNHALYMNRYVYVIAEEPTWVLGDYMEGAQ